MEKSRLIILVVALIAVATGLLAGFADDARKSSAQGADKFLDIARYANEPLELVDLKVSEQSVRSKIKVKYRSGDEGRNGVDRVEFQDKEDWPRRVRLRLRNVSGKTIVGFQAYLYLKPSGSEVRFSVGLTSSSPLESTVLQPGDEIEGTVDEGSWERMVNRLRQYGGDQNQAAVRLSVEIVAFSNGLQWHHGHLLRPDPENPNKRIPIETKEPQEFIR
jgi:hypothetical protein